MGREHEGDRVLVGCTQCDRVMVARETNDGDIDVLGIHDGVCPECGNEDFEIV